MLWSPTNATPGAYDLGGDADPWADTVASSESNHRESDEEPCEAEPAKLPRHTRSQTTEGHPLRSGPMPTNDEVQNITGRSSSLGLHETRPSLRRAIIASRALSEGDWSVDNGRAAAHTERKAEKPAETEVIVHQIQPGDSLPGVALKYNIALATLRNANKLWTTDSIHLRETLYIPVQAVAPAATKSVPNTPYVHSDLSPHSSQSALDANTPLSRVRRRNSIEFGCFGEPETTMSYPSTRTISEGDFDRRRVPLSELSFFPPPSSSLSSSRHAGPLGQALRTRSNPHTTRTLSSSFPYPAAGAVPAFGLTNLLSGAKDEIINRLSFDSARGSGSSEAEEEHDVELDVVQPDGTYHGDAPC
ncbi:carbohydrate-binding module family 50 protein [Ramaria rubella]|nr:carbohydrate-binding module family 50 protein [Ramaria rubella]